MAYSKNTTNVIEGMIFDPLRNEIRCIYPGEIAVAIHEALPNCDQHQSNGLFCIHQLRVRRPGDKTVYRIIVAPADAPIQIGSVPADEHFSKPII